MKNNLIMPMTDFFNYKDRRYRFVLFILSIASFFASLFVHCTQPGGQKYKSKLHWLLLCLGLCCMSFYSVAQCPAAGVTFYTQAQVDNFLITYPTCTTINGYVLISDNGTDPITNLQGLSHITTITNALQITGNPALNSLSDLQNLTTVTDGIGLQNTALINLHGLEQLTSTSGFSVAGNLTLTDISALSGLTSVGTIGIAFQNNPALTSLNGLQNITTNGGRLYIWDNDGLTNLNGLNGLTTITGEVSITGNDHLTNLAGLNNLHSTGNNLIIGSNAALNSLSALSNLTAIGGHLSVTSNNMLGTLSGLDHINHQTITKLTLWGSILDVCHVESICNYLDIPGNQATVNGIGDCANRTAVIEACTPSPVNEVFVSGVHFDCVEGNYVLNVTLTNMSASALQVINLSNSGLNLPNAGFIMLTPAVATGETRSLALPVTGLNEGYELCNFFADAITVSNQILPVQVNVGIVCAIAPPCSPCELLRFTVAPTITNGEQVCCYEVGVENNLSAQNAINQFRFSSQTGTPFEATLNTAYAGQWTRIPATGVASQYVFLSTQGNVSNQMLANLFQICRSDFSGMDTYQFTWNSGPAMQCASDITLEYVCPAEPMDTCNYSLTTAATGIINAGNNPITFTNMPGNGPDIRAYRNIGIQGNNWKATFDLKITQVGINGGAVIPFALTAGSQQFSCYPTLCNVDALGIQVWTPVSQQGPIWIAPYVKNGYLVRPPSCEIPINKDQVYSVTLQRVNALEGKLIVKNENGILINECCFSIPEGLTGLNTVQVSNLQTAWAIRSISGQVNKVCLLGESPTVCNTPLPCVVIVQDSVYCESGQVKVALTLQNNGASTIQSVQLNAAGVTPTPLLANIVIAPGQTAAVPAFTLSGPGVIAGQDICYSIDVFAGLDGMQQLTCNDSIIDNCIPIPQCFDCNDIDIVLEPYHPAPFIPLPSDSCCFDLIIQNNNAPGAITGFTMSSNSVINYELLSTKWNFVPRGFIPDNKTIDVTYTGGDLPVGFLQNIARMCVPEGTVQVIHIDWTDAQGHTLCTDSLEIECPGPPCPDITFLYLQDNVENNCCTTVNLTANNSNLEWLVFASMTNNCPLTFDYDPNLYNVQYTSGNNCVIYVSSATGGPLSTGTFTFCADPALSGPTPIEIIYVADSYACRDSFELPDCAPEMTNCDALTVYQELFHTTPNPNPCGWFVGIENNMTTGTVASVSLETADGSALNFTPFQVSALGFVHTNISPGLAVLTHNSGIIPTGFYPHLYTYSLPAGQSQTIYLTWKNSQGEVICIDTIYFQCPPPPAPCDKLDAAIIPINSGIIPGQCCFSLEVTNALNNTSVSAIIVETANQSDIPWLSNSAFIVDAVGFPPQDNSVLIISDPTNAFPMGTSSPISFCMPAGYPLTKYYVSWVQNINGQTVIICRDSFDLECPSLCDPACEVDQLNLSTGFNQNSNIVLAPGSLDGDWLLVGTPDPSITVPQPASVIAPISAWTTLPGTNWISAYPYQLQNGTNLPPAVPYTFRNCFEICNNTTVNITAKAHIDNRLRLDLTRLDGTLLGNILNITATSASTFTNPPEMGTLNNVPLLAGSYCLVAELRNDNAQSPMGLDMEVFVTGANLIRQDCSPIFTAIKGEKYWDKNCNGTRDNALVEPGLANWGIELLNAAGTVIATTTTDNYGQWIFANLSPGTYTVREINQPIWVQTEPSAGGTYSITLAADEVKGIYRFGNCRDESLPCDYDLVLTPINSDGDSCCWKADLVNNVFTPNQLTKVQISSTNNVPFQITASNPLFTTNQLDAFNAEITLAAGGLLPNGISSDAFDICVAAGSTAILDVFYVKTNNTFCEDSISLSCSLPVCFDWADSLVCNDGEYQLNITIEHHLSTEVVQYVLDVPGGIVFNPAVLEGPFQPDIAYTFVVDVSVTSSDSSLCYSIYPIYNTSPVEPPLPLPCTEGGAFNSCVTVPPCDSVIVVDTLCVSLVDASISCSDGQLNYCFTVQNTTDQPMSYPMLLSAANASFSPSQVTITVPAHDSATYCVPLVGVWPVEGTTVCVAHFGQTGAMMPLEKCFEACVVVPPCDSMIVVDTLCVSLVDASMSCSDGQLNYCFTVQNTTDQPMNYPMLLSAANASFSPSQVTITVPAHDSATYCVPLVGIWPVEGATVCVAHFGQTGAMMPLEKCFEACVAVPPCDSEEDTLCISLVDASMSCSNGQLNYCFTVQNTTDQPMNYPMLLSAANASFSPSQVSITVPAHDSATYCVPLVGVLPVEGTTVCVAHFGQTGEMMPLEKCFEACVVVPPCDSMIVVDTLCVSLVDASMSCSNGQLNYCFTVQNTTDQPMSYPMLLSATNASFSPSQVTITVPAHDSATYCVPLVGVLPVEGTTVCVAHFGQTGAMMTLEKCFEACVTVPLCNSDVVDTMACIHITGDGFDCVDGLPRYSFYLENGTGHPIRSIVIIPENSNIEVVPDEIILPSPGLLPGQTGGPYLLDLMGGLIPDNTFCYSIEVRDQPQSDNPSFVYRDTITTGCRAIPACPQQICIVPVNDSLTCEPVGRLYYNFTVSNPATNTFSIAALDLNFSNTSDSSHFLSEPLVLTPALGPGQSRTVRMEIFKWGNFKEGDPICFGVTGYNSLEIPVDDTGICDTTCLPLPACACQQTCYECCTDLDLQLPTGVSPNGDNLNDTYTIGTGNKTCPLELRIYNRWGNMVWKEDNIYLSNWDGTNTAGETLPEGTYYVLIRIKATGQTISNFVDLKRQ